MTDFELTKVKSPILHIPTVLGAVVLTYNLPGVDSGLKLNGDVISDIFFGDIRTWNDPKIQALNPDKKLPNLPLLVVHRTDGSGTTYVFTDYLSKVSRRWKTKVGTGKAVSWPTGSGSKGNEGVSAKVKQLIGAIGYVELSYAIENRLAYANIKNKSANYVAPSIDSVSLAADTSIPNDYRVSITDSSGVNAYPISAFTYLLVYREQRDGNSGEALVSFLRWAMNDGQKMVSELHYAPLPTSLVQRLQKTIQEIQVVQK